jgi:hypothetical protein
MKEPNDLTLHMLEIVEQEMIQMWLHDEIPQLIKDDSEFVSTILSAIMLERSYWMKFMVVGEA